MSRRIYRYEVPVDDQWHVIPLSTNPLHVASRRLNVVELWHLVEGNATVSTADAQVADLAPLPARAPSVADLA